MPEPWLVVRQGRRFIWTAQALGDPAPMPSLRFGLDERAVLFLGDSPSTRNSLVRRHQLNFMVLNWARQRLLQWQQLLSGSPGPSTETLLPALQRHETRAALRLADRIWMASLNAKLEVTPVSGSGATALLRWVAGARSASEYRRRRALAVRHRTLLSLAYCSRDLSRQKWPWCLRRLNEDELPRLLRHLKLPSWAHKRISSRRLQDAFRERPLEQQLIAWKRLSAQLPQRLWPNDPEQLQAAEAVLAYLSPLFSFGMPLADAYDLPGDERRLRWVLGQLHGEHEGNWGSLLGALRADVPLTALMHGTLPRLREVLSIVHEGDAQVMEIFSSPLRAWGPGRWRVGLQDWHHRTLGGRPGPRLRWNGLLAGTVTQDGHAFSSPATWDDLRALLDAVASQDWQPLVTEVLRGSAQFIEIRSTDSDQLVGLAALRTAAPSKGDPDAEWPRNVEMRLAPGVDVQQREAAKAALAILLATHQGLDWPLLHWRQNWESALRQPELAKRLACSFLKTWHLMTP
jgi:hypothetical protein